MQLRIISGILIMLLIASYSKAQEHGAGDDFILKMHYYNLQKPYAALFVHFDKTVYTNNESVWFTGYILKGNPAKIYNTLSIALLNNADSTVAAEEKFVMANGLSFGNILLPDSLPPGNYSLIAYTNQLINGIPEDVFIQPVTIKTVTDANFTALLKITDTAQARTDSVRMLLKATTKDGRVLTGAEVIYTIGKGKQVIASGKTKTNAFGEHVFVVPAAKITAANNLLQVQVTADKEIKRIRLQLPVYDKEPVVKFYPEGGHLIDDMFCVVGVEVTTAVGEPLPATALLYENGHVLDTIQTDSYGMGHFELAPQPGNKYTLKLLNNGSAGKEYFLPATLPEGPVVGIRNALAEDSFTVKLSTMQTGMYHLVLHDYRQVYQVFDLQVKQPVSKELTFPLQDVPKGLIVVTLLDSVGRPWTERMIFAHYNRRSFIRITTDSQYYNTRQKVQLSLKLGGDTANGGKALVSIACVQENRLEARKMQDIESYFYLKHALQPMPYRYRPVSNDKTAVDYLQNVLLIKGWRRYTWQEMIQARPEDTLQQHVAMQFTGQVTKYEKQLKKPATLAVIHDSSIGILTTDTTGGFILDGESIVMAQGHKVMLAVSNDRVGEYNIEITDPYKVLNKKLGAEIAAVWEEPKSPVQDTRQTMIPGDEKVKTLAAVVVTPGGDNSLYGTKKNACGDYVCLYGILNCPNHPFGGREPVAGQAYYSPGSGGARVTYVGCNEMKRDNVIAVKGIYTHKEFYGSDYSVANPPDAEYISTIFWKHMAVVTSDKETTFSFYTSDIGGRFRIIVQGVTSNGVVYGEQVFTVRKPQD